MRSLHPRQAVVAGAILAVATAIPAATSAQTGWRPACDLLDDATLSGILGVDVTAQREGTRQMCFYEDANGSIVGSISLLSDVDLSLFAAQEGAEPITVDGREGVASPFGQEDRVIVALSDGGLLDISMRPPGREEAELQALATSLAEAILGTGAVSAIPTDRGVVDGLYVVTTMCDALPVEQVNAITGGDYVVPDFEPSGDEACLYSVRDGFESVSFNFGSDVVGGVDAGTYASEEVTVAGRPATWDPVFGLTVDAGAERTIHVSFVEMEPDPARRDQAIALAEALIANLTSVAPPTPTPPPGAASCDVSLDELSRMTGLEITGAAPFGALCFYTAGDSMSGVLIGVLPGDDPASALEAADFTSDVEPTPTDVDGRPALMADAPTGSALAVDLDGLPGGDGQVLVVAVGGLPEGSDQLAVATELVRLLISQM